MDDVSSLPFEEVVNKKTIESVIMIIPRPPPSFFRTVIALDFFLRCFLINYVIRYIMKPFFVNFWVRFLPKNMLDGRNPFQEIGWEKQG